MYHTIQGQLSYIAPTVMLPMQTFAALPLLNFGDLPGYVGEKVKDFLKLSCYRFEYTCSIRDMSTIKLLMFFQN